MVLVACGGKGDPTTPTAPTDGDDTGTPAPTTPVTEPIDPCATPLTLAPSVPGVVPFQGVRFVASGGSGDVTFELVEDRSGAIVDRLTGAYLSGPIANVVDEVEATDGVCGGTARASIEVWGGMVLRPETAVVPPGTSFTVETVGGSGSISCRQVRAETGGSLAGCTWTGGALTGTDEIEVTDTVTEEVAVGSYSVDPSVVLGPWGGRLYLPVGRPFAPTFVGGTQVVDLTPSAGGLQAVDGVLTGVSEGSYTVAAVDHFAPALSATLNVEVIEPRTAPAVRDGERYQWGTVLGGDVDGDGYDDLIVGSPEVSLSAHVSGVVHGYAGGPAGLSVAPVWSWSVPQQYATAGRGVALGDFDGDGFVDLAVGADGWDEGFVTDYGRVDVFFGVPGGWWAAEPTLTLRGEIAGDRAGYALTACDIDGDGDDELAVSAYGAEAAGSGVSSQGAVFVWSGDPGGLAPDPTWRLYGRTPSGGVFVDDGDAQLGKRLVGGDWDGDGRCDLVATSHTVNLDGAGSDGVVWLWDADAVLAEGEPTRLWTTDDPDDNQQVGRAITMGDVDDDGRDDLVLGGYTVDAPGVTRGAVWVLLAADDDGRAATAPVMVREASVVIRGDSDYDQLGQGLALGALDADPGADLLIGSVYDELSGGTSAVGTVLRFGSAALTGLPAGTELLEADAEVVWAGVDVNDCFGAELGIPGDTDGDGVADPVTYATRDDGDGIEAGGLYVLADDGTAARLSLPGSASGQHLGDRGAVGWVDLDGNGDPDPVAGAWGTGRAPDGYDSGVAYGWTTSTAASRDFQGMPNHSANDRVGQAVGSAGDFDGDGREDLVVVAWNDSKPTTFGTEFANPSDCPGSVSGTGAAWVYRGEAGGIATAPAFVVYGYGSGDHLEVVDGRFDHDGDGFDDLVLASTGDGAEGGVTVVYGRPRDPAGITVICATEHFLGVSSGSRLGSAVAAVGDLDRDGCDELALGADADDLGVSNQGSVRILWGHGASCARATAEVTTLGPGVANTRFGGAVDGGLDVDGDGVPDVVASGYDFEEIAGVDVGAVWMLSGSWLAGLQRQSAVPLPSDGGTVVHALPAARWSGTVRDGELGSDVAVVLDPARPGRGLVAAGWRYGTLGGVPLSGGAVVLGWGAGTFLAEPVGLIGGEAGSQLGDGLRGDPRAPVLLVGGPLVDGAAVDSGAVMPVTLR